MKIAFLFGSNEIAEPLGVMHLSSILRMHHHDVRLFFSSYNNWLDRIIKYAPDVVAYSVITGSHQFYIKLNNIVKSHLNSFSIFGGPHPTFFPEIIDHSNIDAICIGEGEFAFLDLITAMANNQSISNIKNIFLKENGRIIKNEVRPLIQSLDDLPFPDRSLVYNEDKYLYHSKIKRFINSRGCPFNCTYCFNRAYKEIYKGDKIIRWRSFDNVIKEILEVKDKYPIELVRFIDDIFILPPLNWLENFRSLYKKEINLPFVCNLQVKILSEDKIRLLKEAGCIAVYMAIEAGNDRMREDILDRKMSKQEIIKAFDLVHKFGLRIGAENILGLPGGSLNMDIETIDLNIKCRVDNPISTLFQPYPRTKLGEYAFNHGYFNGNLNSISKSYFIKSNLIFSSSSEKRQIENLHKFFGFSVKFPFMLSLIIHMIRLPPNRLFNFFYRFWDSWFKYRYIFRIHFSIKDILFSFFRIIKY